VISDSPAEAAGLKLGDAIFQFGPVNSTNHENLQAIVNLVKQKLNQEIIVRVLRKTLLGTSEEKELKFTPREWGGRGYLGCALKLNPI
jgi:26S proteasome regulatory subunit N4